MLKWCRHLHNWLGLILFVQILLWFLSGLVMAILPIEQVRGEHLRTTPSAQWQQALISPALVLANHSQHASFSLGQQLSMQPNGLSVLPVYLVDDAGQRFRYSAVDGQPLTALSAPQIAELAQAQYQGNGSRGQAVLLQQAPAEVRQLPTPLWQLQFADGDNTVFYLDPATGAVLRVRTDGWRWFDFFWMLHIMDYDERSNFNNPLLITTAGASLLFTLTGILLLWQRYRPKRRRQNFNGATL
ncbi:MAG: PepSY domain-containing protein [Gammaproteobacteria bacterium]|nr:PepSY domain-containing protein [Gammaproteobacteria bacterium]MBU2183662.1 PepSY domain-containing protein [Gammaproteobacteria bacterium]MBU2205576.1 PepSY domain-containing protein [Gammaproteobacteria bacterium]